MPVFLWGGTDKFLEQTYEVVLGQTCLLRQFGDGQIPVDVLVDV